MVTIIDCYHKASWIGHPVKVRYIIYLFVGFTPISHNTLFFIEIVLLIRQHYYNGSSGVFTESWSP